MRRSALIIICVVLSMASPAWCDGDNQVNMAPDGTFVYGMLNLAPDGTFVGGTPHLAPDGTFVGTDGDDY